MVEDLLLIATGAMVALATGIFLAFSVAINGAMHRLKDIEYVHAMQWIDYVIQRNGLFLLCFMGPVLLLPLVVFLYGGGVGTLEFSLLFGSMITYLVGMAGVTFVGNIPLNVRLVKFDADKGSAQEVAKARALYESPWNRLHTIRTTLGVISTILFFWALVV